MKYVRGILLLSGVLLAIYGVRDDALWLLS